MSLTFVITLCLEGEDMFIYRQVCKDHASMRMVDECEAELNVTLHFAFEVTLCLKSLSGL